MELCRSLTYHQQSESKGVVSRCRRSACPRAVAARRTIAVAVLATNEPLIVRLS